MQTTMSAQKITVNPRGAWRLHWGAMPIPAKSRILGTVTIGSKTGALLQFGRYMRCGNAGTVTSLPQRDTYRALAVSVEADERPK